MCADETISDFAKLIEIEKQFRDSHSKWIFRAEENGKLRTKIEMAFEQFGIKEEDKPATEKDLIREFQRKLHLYPVNLPVRNDIMQWLALMQHYGAPTRLLDWTYSFWVAVFFAIAKRKIDDTTFIWALNTSSDDVVRELKAVQNNIDALIKEIVTKDKSLTYSDKSLIEDCAIIFTMLENKCGDGFYVANPFRLNDRLTIQQGVFVIPCNVKKSFENNIKGGEKLGAGVLKKYIFVMNRDFQQELLSYLRQMNINSAVLFPGLQGFAESLWMRAGIPMGYKLLGQEQEDKLQLYTDP